ncbi:type II toxin-antitoxin system prevent-host-death family antitoxin [Candidatus Albibeggiatoa sp. nov. BB20]|uniref:type II toxin-antitoxin system Phd/YefM family antitoxin n=1 Tax=Candidatus Albibeggiatoa sp. nov. BB20 TaxID=3162723 RepID=UPI0033653762
MDAVTINYASQNLPHLIKTVTNNTEPTIICSDTGDKAVLISLEEFNAWQETLYLLSNPANAERLQQSIEQAKTGKKQQRQLIKS